MTKRELISEPSAEGGFSLIEVLIGAALLLFIAIGVAPLFTAAMMSNRSGQESTEVSNLATSKLEELVQLPFRGAELSLDSSDPLCTSPGCSCCSGMEKVYRDYLSAADKEWKDGTPPTGDPGLYARTTTVRQYGVQVDPVTAETSLTDPLPEGAPPASVHVKGIEVRVEGTGSGPLGPGKRIVVTLWKSQ